VYNLDNLEKNGETLKDLGKLSQGRIKLALFNLNDRGFADSQNFPFFYVKPTHSIAEIRALKKLGVSEVILDYPLTHNLHEVKKINIKTRAIPVFSFLDEIPREDGVCGNWFRPEDVDAYSVYIDTIEFGS
jgi:hypothetical protein